MCFLENRRADAFGAEQTGQARECFGEPRRIAERSFEKMKLFERRLGRFGLEPDGNDRRFRSKIFQVRVKHPEKRFDVVRRLGNFESVRVAVLVAENNFELELADDEMDRVQSQGKLLEKPAQHEEERLARFDFVFEFERFL